MNWQNVCQDPHLQELPYTLELNEWGQIVMTPVSIEQGAYQVEIARLLSDHLPKGQCVVGCAIKTRLGTKVADIAWLSAERWKQTKKEDHCLIAPEICIKIILYKQSEAEINLKKHLYFEAGAEEVWLCDQKGYLYFYHIRGKLNHSWLAPEFPKKVNL